MQDFLNSTNFTSIFIGLIVFKFALETYLKIRNLSSIEKNKNKIPERFTSVVTDEEYKKSIEYNFDRLKFQIFTSLFGAVVLILFTIGGLLTSLTDIVVGITDSEVIGAVLLGLLLLVVEEILSIPISIYSTFVIEEKHGFNKTTKKTFITDILKGLLISGTISSVLYATVIYIVVNLGDMWWLYAFGAVFVLQAMHHEVVGARMAKKILKELKYDNKTIEDIALLVEQHLRPHTFKMGWTDSAVRRYIVDAGHMLEDLNELVRADVTTKNKVKAKEIYENLDEMEKRIEEVKAKEELSKIRPALSGDEVMEHFNIQPGPKVGVIMKALYEQRINDGEVSKEDALKLAEETYKNL